MAQERQPKPTITGVLIREEAEHDIPFSQKIPKLAGFGATLEKTGPCLKPHSLQDGVELRIRQGAVCGGNLPLRGYFIHSREKLKISEMSDRAYHGTTVIGKEFGNSLPLDVLI
jgi:hypothetical protein